MKPPRFSDPANPILSRSSVMSSRTGTRTSLSGCLRMKRPASFSGARSVMLSAEKQVLYENMDDCVNGAVTGLNIAVYNLRSACRIGSRTDFCKW